MVGEQIIDSAIRLVDGHVRISAGAGVRIGDGYTAEGLAAANPRFFAGLSNRGYQDRKECRRSREPNGSR